MSAVVLIVVAALAGGLGTPLRCTPHLLLGALRKCVAPVSHALAAATGLGNQPLALRRPELTLFLASLDGDIPHDDSADDQNEQDADDKKRHISRVRSPALQDQLIPRRVRIETPRGEVIHMLSGQTAS